MKILFEFDFKNYKTNGTVGKRPSVRGVIIRDEKIALVHSEKYDYYKIPGGGIEGDETQAETLIREVREEVGLEVIPETIKEYGYVLRKEKGKIEDLFIQENFYYFCDVKDKAVSQHLDKKEEDEQFVLKWVQPEIAIEANRIHNHGDKNSDIAVHMMEREALVLEKLMEEGYFKIITSGTQEVIHG
ncbi:MAG: NUDIX domain-containing protein [Butyrivibrio sp.]